MAKKKKAKKSDEPQGGVRTVTTAELQALVLANQLPVLVDVRSGMEFAGGHVPGARNLPLPQIASWSGQLPEGEIWVICRSGNRSATAAEHLAKQGRQVVNVAGGMMTWSGPTTRMPSPMRLLLPLGASLTLGLAPFLPEPHLVGKIRWIAGGAVGMGGMDWFDVVLHGAPWVWLAYAAVRLGMDYAKAGRK